MIAIGVGSPAHAADTEAPSVPGPITIAEITTTTVVLTWAASTDDVGVTRYDVSHFMSDVGIIRSTPTNSITITGLGPSTTHRFMARARDAAGNSSLSTPMLVVTMPPGDSQPPTTPGTPAAVQVADNTVTLRWTASTDNIYVALYEVLLVSATGSPVVATAPQHPPTGPTARVSGLTPGTTYTFAIRARDDAGNYSALSAPVTVTTTGGTSSCAVTYRVVRQWGGAFEADVQIRNTSATTVEGWVLAWSFTAGQQVRQLWNAAPVPGATGPAVRDAGWNRWIAPGGTVPFGFIGSWNVSNPPAVGFTLNGAPCDAA